MQPHITPPPGLTTPSYLAAMTPNDLAPVTLLIMDVPSILCPGDFLQCIAQILPDAVQTAILRPGFALPKRVYGVVDVCTQWQAYELLGALRSMSLFIQCKSSLFPLILPFYVSLDSK